MDEESEALGSKIINPWSSTTHQVGIRKKKMMRNKRRFSDEQIRSMESIFESESSLEPSKKLELATELGLQPRQVAIWFQNKRARWRSKRLEQDYNVLQGHYHALASRFEALKRERQALAIQLEKLNDLVRRPEKVENGERSIVSKGDDDEYEVKPSFSELERHHENDEDSSTTINAVNLAMEEEEEAHDDDHCLDQLLRMTMAEPEADQDFSFIDIMMASSNECNWRNNDTNNLDVDLFDQSITNYHN